MQLTHYKIISADDTKTWQTLILLQISLTAPAFPLGFNPLKRRANKRSAPLLCAPREQSVHNPNETLLPPMSVLATQSRDAQPRANGINNEGMSAIVIARHVRDILNHEFKQKLRNAVLLRALEVGWIVHVSE